MKISVTIGLLLVLFFSIQDATAQSDKVKIKKSEFRIEGKDAGLKSAWKNIKQGNKLYKAGIGTYRQAREHYLKAYKYNPDNPELNYRIGVCYLYTDDKYEAIKYLAKAHELDDFVASDINFLIGRAYQYVLEFDLAIDHYNAYLSNLTIKETKNNPGLLQRTTRNIEECNNGKQLVQEPVRVIIQNLGNQVNSVYDDYNIVFTPDFKEMYFASRRSTEEEDDRSSLDNKFLENIFVTDKNGDKFSKAQPAHKNLDEDYNMAPLAFADNGKTFYLYDGYKKRGTLVKSEFNTKKNKWRKPKDLKGKFNTKERETDLAITADGKTIFFVSGREDETLGGKDIFYSRLNNKGQWEKPRNIGNTLNTIYDEEAIAVDSAGKVLYFSSRGHNSMGGYDVFYSEMNEVGKWSTPVNMGYPINTPDDELFYTPSDNEKYAYYTAIRESGIGAKDLYRIIYLGEEKEAIISTEEDLVAFFGDTLSSLFFYPVNEMVLDTAFIMKGKILDSENQEPVVAKLELIDTDQSRVIGTAVSNQKGEYHINLPQKKAYGVEIMARGYLFYLDVVDIDPNTSDQIVYRDFLIDRVEVGAKVVLENIFFEFAKATLKTESYQSLQQVVKFLENNPSIRLEISGHTDNVGSMRSNMKLSEERAKSVVDYLVEQGIAPSRLEYKGYAYTQPIAPNDTNEGRELNRRVEFKVLSK